MRKQSGRNGQVFFALIFFFLLITVPYAAAYFNQGSDHVFSGFLLNPIDGNSYLAKMYQGWQGEVTFQLPYTAERTQGVYLFMYYLFLGHLARVTSLPLIIVFHLARLLGAGFLVWAVNKYVAQRFEPQGLQNHLLVLVMLGLGTGWLALPFGEIVSDLWVAEAFPFLSSFVNPHFPLGLAIMTVLIFQQPERFNFINVVLLASMALMLALAVPFGVVIVGMVLLIEVLLEYLTMKPRRVPIVKFSRLLIIGAVSVPVIAYDLWVVNTDPLLAGWNAQNLTPSPPVWDFILAFSPALIFSGLALWLVREEPDRVVRLAGIWFAAGVLLMYFPFGLQRRMISGLFIPIVILAVYWFASRYTSPRRQRNVGYLILASLPSVIVLSFLTGVGISQRAPELYLWRDEIEAFAWLKEETSSDVLVLSSPDSGLFIPAHTGRRVFYGHPFETVNADFQIEFVTAIYQNLSTESIDGLPEQVDYIFWGPRETAEYGVSRPQLPFRTAYQNDGVIIYATQPEP